MVNRQTQSFVHCQTHLNYLVEMQHYELLEFIRAMPEGKKGSAMQFKLLIVAKLSVAIMALMLMGVASSVVTVRAAESIQMFPHSDMQQYLQLKNAFGDEFELAGFPGVSGEPYYPMYYDYSFGMNALSAKKEAVWGFFEYLLSEPVQQDYAKGGFPVRYDVLEQILQDDMNMDYTSYRWTNDYTYEMEERPPFTEADKQVIQKMLEYVKRFSVMDSNPVTYIITEELQPFFSGDKSAKDTAALIQNRVQLYLDEMR